MPEVNDQSEPQPQATTTPKSTNWKKIGLTIVFIIGVVAIVSSIYWFLVVQNGSSSSDLTGPVPKVTTKTATVVVKTDKVVYQNGESIKITVKNKKDKPIFYYGPFWHLKEYAYKLDVQIPTEVSMVNGKETCGLILYEQWIGELEPGGNISDEWDQWICLLEKGKGPFEAKLIDNGGYSIGFTYGEETVSSDAFTVKDPKTIYSNVFTIK